MTGPAESPPSGGTPPQVRLEVPGPHLAAMENPTETSPMTNLNARPSAIRPATVKLLAKLMNPLADAGLIYVPEMNEIVAQLRHLALKGCPMPPIAPKLLTQEEAADMLGISYSNFKKLEKEGHFPFKRKMVGTSVRFRNLDILEFMLTDDVETIPGGE